MSIAGETSRDLLASELVSALYEIQGQHVK